MNALTDVQRWARAMEEARAQRDAAIMTARIEGETWTDIAVASGLTIQGLIKLSKREASRS